MLQDGKRIQQYIALIAAIGTNQLKGVCRVAVCRCLAPNGILVLEPQPFKSYKNAVHKPGVHEAPFHKLDELKLRPDAFCDFLTQRVGFELVQQLHAVSDATGSQAVPVKGFDRPILVLRKLSAVDFSLNVLN
jgi:hypothetical protein